MEKRYIKVRLCIYLFFCFILQVFVGNITLFVGNIPVNGRFCIDRDAEAIYFCIVPNNKMVMEQMNLYDEKNVLRLDQGVEVLTEMTFSPLSAGLLKDCFAFLLVLNGSAKINVDYAKYSVSANTLVVVSPLQYLGFREISSDFSYRLMVVPKGYMKRYEAENILPLRLSLPDILEKSYFRLKRGDLLLLDKAMVEVEKKLAVDSHHFYEAVVMNSLSVFFLEMANIENLCKVHTGGTFSYGEALVEEFLSLLFSHFKEQHAVSFYADKLSVTSQYLSLMLNKYTGKSTLKWIQHALLSEARMLLLRKVSISDISYYLHFEDASSFGHFFRKHLGISPLKYRNTVA